MTNQEKPITPQDVEWVRIYLLNGMRAKEAAMEAYACTKKRAEYKANQLLNRPEIVHLIREEMEGRIQRLRIDADYVLQEAAEIYRRCAQKTKILDRFGEPTGEYRFDAANALKALQLIGQHIDVSAFEERQAHKDADQAMVDKIRQGRLRASRKSLPSLMDEDTEDQPTEAPEESTGAVIEGEVIEAEPPLSFI